MTRRKFFVKFCPLDISAINTLYENNVRIEIFCQVTLFEKASMASNWRLRAGDKGAPISNILVLTVVRLCTGFCSKDLKKHGVRTCLAILKKECLCGKVCKSSSIARKFHHNWQ